MVCKSLQVEELQIRVDTWKQGVLIWNNYGKIGIKSFLANETKVKQKKNMQNVKKVEEMSNKQPKNMNRERKFKKKLWKSNTK